MRSPVSIFILSALSQIFTYFKYLSFSISIPPILIKGQQCCVLSLG
nr:MAG TPA: hypothetical protein [Caudoviricetes sp.]DAY60369.1 MAG TPA: hypothetical protein [Caudoviricetes sp.]